MKKSYKISIIICCAVIFIGVISIGVVLKFSKQEARTTYVFSPKMSLAFFGREPTEFFKTYYDYYDNCEDFRNHATIDENGNLVIRLTSEQKAALFQSTYTDLEALDAVEGVEISANYDRLTITGNEEEVLNVIWNEFEVYPIFHMANCQLIGGTDPENISVTVTIIDKDTGNPIYTAVWPDEDVCFGPETLKFPKTNSEDNTD